MLQFDDGLALSDFPAYKFGTMLLAPSILQYAIFKHSILFILRDGELVQNIVQTMMIYIQNQNIMEFSAGFIHQV